MNRVLFLSSIYPRAYDRTRGPYSHATCKAIAAKREVCVISPRSWIEALRKPAPHDAQLAHEVGRIEYPTYLYPPKVGRNAYDRWMWGSIRRRALTVGREFRPQGILSYWAHPDGATAVKLARSLGVPAAIMVGGSDVLLLTSDVARRRVISRTLASADAVIAVSQHIREKAIALGVEPSRIHVVYRGVDESFAPGDRGAARARVGLPNDREVLLWVGRISPEKGLEVLLGAMKELVRARPNAHLVLVGDGAQRGELERWVAEQGLGAHVTFKGSLGPAELPDWYRAADRTVISSHSEGIPNVLRESLACGIPYVSTRVGGIPELCTHPAVRLVPPGDPSALARALDESLTAGIVLPPDILERGWEKRADELVGILERAAALRP